MPAPRPLCLVRRVHQGSLARWREGQVKWKRSLGRTALAGGMGAWGAAGTEISAAVCWMKLRVMARGHVR